VVPGPERADSQRGRGLGRSHGVPPRPAGLVRGRARGHGAGGGWRGPAPAPTAVVSGLVAAAIADGIAGLGHYPAIAGIVALFSLAVAACTAALARIWPPLVAVAVLAFIVLGIPVSGGAASLAAFTPGFLRVLSPILPLGVAAGSLRDVVYFAGHGAEAYLWTLAAWTVAGVSGLILVTALRRPGPAVTEAVTPPPVPADLTPAPRSPERGAARPVSLVVGFDDSEPARRALVWAADLVRSRPGVLHVIYAEHALIESDLSGFAQKEMAETRDDKAARVAEAAAELVAAAAVPYTFERRQEAPAEAILHAASIHAAAEPASPPVIVTGRSHHAAHQVLGSVPVRLLHQSPYPVLTIT
jgi:nucleotide-binding universal stress UspA family protein